MAPSPSLSEALWWWQWRPIPALFDKTMSNVKEVKARGADVLGLTLESMAQEGD